MNCFRLQCNFLRIVFKLYIRVGVGSVGAEAALRYSSESGRRMIFLAAPALATLIKHIQMSGKYHFRSTKHCDNNKQCC
jgi:hypothetical protein